MKKKQSVPRLIEKHKKIISIYKVFACLSMASLLTMIVFMFAVERKPFQTVMIIAVIALLFLVIALLVSKYADKIQGQINQGG